MRVSFGAALAGFGFGVWLLGMGIPLDAAILLSVIAAVAVVLGATPRPRQPRPWDPEE